MQIYAAINIDEKLNAQWCLTVGGVLWISGESNIQKYESHADNSTWTAASKLGYGGTGSWRAE